MSEYKEIPLNQIKTKSNYRKTFNDKTLKELAVSIKENGVLEPIIVRANGDGFEIIAGERRVRASHLAKLATIPAIVREVSDGDFLKFQLIENIQREDVPFMEEAYGLRDLRDKHDADISELAKLLGKSEVYIDYMLKLTQMSADAQEAARHGELTKSDAVLVARLPNHENQSTAARDLRRTNKKDCITVSGARKYVQKHFSDTGLCQPRPSPIKRQNGNDFCANWKKHLLTFNCQQFEYFKTIARGRTDTDVLSEAVERVMMNLRVGA
jgi:ParB family chromosome partitioning protein